MRLAMTMACALAAACGSGLGDPGVKPLPAPDPYAPLQARTPQSPRLANYWIDARLDASKRTITARQRLEWTNASQRAVTVLPFHLYMNAFKNEGTVFMTEAEGRHRSAEASDTDWGWIEVRSAMVDGATAIMRFPGPEGDETVMELALASPLPPGSKATVDFEFEVQLPEVFARTGYKGEFFLIAQWFPKIGVLTGTPGAEEWHCKPFHLNSEFFADFGTYEVSLTVPDTHTIAATGVLTRATDNPDSTRTLVYRAEDVHDFAWMADPYMKVIKATAQTELGPVEVRVYHRAPQEDFARRHLHAGVGAIEHFSKLYVPYPWPIMSIIDPPPDAGGGAGGMEYPTLVTTAGDSVFMRPGMYMPEYVTVHEVGHNWFQGILASNEVEEAWLDEGVNEYADSLVMEAIYGQGTSSVDWRGLHADTLTLSRAGSTPMARIPAPIDTPSYAYPDWGSYGDATYGKTAMAMRTLENIVGVDAFRGAMRTYAQRFQFKHPTGKDLFGTLEEVLGRELDWYLEPAFRSIGAVAYDVRSVDCDKKHAPRGVFGTGAERKTVLPKDAPETETWSCEVLIVNVGTVPAPVDVLIGFEDGATTRQRWDATGGQIWQRYHLEHTTQVAEVIIDPENRVLLNDNIGQRAWRREAAHGASRRAAARVQHWTQTAMQVMGLL